MSGNQCCGSGMISSGSESSHEISEFRIRIQSILFKNIWKLLKKHLKFYQKKNIQTICHFLFHTTV